MSTTVVITLPATPGPIGALAMPVTVTAYVTTFAPWEEDEDEPRRLGTDEDVREFANATLAVEWMYWNGAVYPSEGPAVSHRTWWSADTYEHPYTGEREETTFHIGDDVPERLRAAMNRAILARV